MDAWPVVDASWGSIELYRPSALALLPVAVLLWWWLRHTPRSHQVGSTFIWTHLGDATRIPATGWPLLLLLVSVVLALTRPVLLPGWNPTLDPLPLFRVLAPSASAMNDALAAEVILPPGSGTATVTVSAGARGLARETVTLATDRPLWRRFPLASLKAGDEGELRVDATSRSATVPAATPPLAVLDESGSPSVAHALDALERCGRIVRHPVNPSPGETPDIIPDIIVTRGTPVGGEPLRGWIRLGRAPDDEVGYLLVPDPGIPAHPLLLGLDARRWWIPRRVPVTHHDLRAADGEVLLDSSAGPLITRRGNVLELAFDPDESGLPELPVWPVLWSRLMELLDAPLAAPAQELTRSRAPVDAPRIGLLLVALALVPWALRGFSKARQLILAVGIVMAATFPYLSWGDPPRARVAVTADVPMPPAERIRQAARQLTNGGVLELPVELPAPLERVALWRQLAARRVRLALSSQPAAVLSVEPTRVEKGGTVTLTASTSGELKVVAPDGSVTRAAVTSRAARRQKVGMAGSWCFQLLDGAERVVAATLLHVSDPIPVVSCAGPVESGAAQLVSDEVFSERRAETLPSLLAELPRPAAKGIILWDGLDPEALDDTGAQTLRQWLDDGGTLLVCAAPPFFAASPGKERLEALLPAPLPDVPRQQQLGLGIILADLSGSMSAGGWEPLVAGIGVLLDATPAGGRWGVCGFRSDVNWLARPGSPVDVELLGRLQSNDPGGGTRLDLALDEVLQRFDPVSGGRNLVLLTDGRDSGAVSWQDYGRRLAAAGIRVTILGVGPRVNDAVLDTLARSAGGDYRRARSATDATRLLADALDPPPGPWRASAALRTASLDPLLNAVPPHLPAPLRRIVASPHTSAHPLLVDREGHPLLLTRRFGTGRSLLWCSGLDAESLPGSGAGSALVSALASILVTASRGTPAVGRNTELLTDVTGARWVAVERFLGDPATAFLEGIGNLAIARERDRYLAPLDFEPVTPFTVALEGVPQGVHTDASANRRALGRLAEPTRPFAPPDGRHSTDLPVLLSALAAIFVRRR